MNNKKALDNKTKKELVDSLKRLGKTLIEFKKELPEACKKEMRT